MTYHERAAYIENLERRAAEAHLHAETQRMKYEARYALNNAMIKMAIDVYTQQLCAAWRLLMRWK